MIAATIITIITFLMLTTSILLFPSVKIGRHKISTYWIIALLGAVALGFFKLVSADEIHSGIVNNSEINPLKILILFFSMTFLSVLLDEVGLFRYLANKTVAIAKSNQLSLFVILYVLTSVLTVFTSNDIVILTLTPFICFFCKNTKINPLPYLVSEFAAANTWSMMLIIGNPTNIYLATSAKISFTEYMKVMALPTIAAGVLEFLLIFFIFRKQLNTELQPQKDNFQIKSKPDLIVGIVHLAICLIFLAISGYINIEMWIVSAVCALSLLAFEIVIHIISGKNWQFIINSFKRLPWQLIPFVLSMFVIVICLNHQGISQKLADLLGEKICIWTYGGASFLAANLINNIPMSILFSSLPVSLETTAYYQAIYASIVGSNIGAFLTPIGALAGIMFTELAERHNVNYGFKQFIKYGVAISLPTIAAALFTLTLVL